MTTFPLLRHAASDAVIAYRAAVPVTCGRFLTDVRQLAGRLADSAQVLNLCMDRYHFSVGLAAALMAGRVSLLPAAHTPGAIRELQTFSRNMVCLTDDPDCDWNLPQLLLDDAHASAELRNQEWDVPSIDNAQTAVILFTSGSTGAPVPHAKTWGSLVQDLRSAAQSLRLDKLTPCSIVGTVPAQHMFGFETTVLAPLLTGNILCAERPFFPADIAGTLAALPAPRVLISTPLHLRALLDSRVTLPALELVVSSTAPLAQDLARALESRLACPLLEIYGSTESGQIAVRRTSHSSEWQLSPDVQLVFRDGKHWVHGGHVETPTALADEIEITGAQRFLLRGRTADLVNIAGKRSSLAYLNHQLNTVPGVLDGAFFQLEGDVGDAADVALPQPSRLAAAVVAPGCELAAITQQLRSRIDPVFLPRPLLLVERLPRDATGKLPRDQLQLLLARRK